MERDEILKQARELIAEGKPFAMATVDSDSCPQVRWMGALLFDEPFTIYMASGVQTRKMKQIEANPHTQLMFQAADYSRVATLSGACEAVDDAAIKQRLWDAIPMLKQYLKGPDDPNLAVLRFTPRRIELLAMQEHARAPYVAEL